MNGLNFHHSYYNYCDTNVPSIYPAEDINPLPGEIEPFPNERVSEIEGYVNQIQQQMSYQPQSSLLNLNTPAVNVNPRKRFFHYRGKILQVVAETEIQRQYPETSGGAQTTHSSAHVSTPTRPFKPRQPRPPRPEGLPHMMSAEERSRSAEERASHAAYERMRRARLPQWKRDELNRKDRERRAANKERYKEMRKQRYETNPDLLVKRKRMRCELQKQYYKKLTPEQKKEKAIQQKERQKERIEKMSPEEYQEYLRKQREKKQRYQEKIKKKEDEKMAKMSEEELRQYLAKKSATKKRGPYRKRRQTDDDDPDEPSTSKKRRSYTKKPQKSITSLVAPAVRQCLYYEFLLKHNSNEAHKNVTKALGDEALPLAACRKWFDRFLEGDISLKDPDDVDLEKDEEDEQTAKEKTPKKRGRPSGERACRKKNPSPPKKVTLKNVLSEFFVIDEEESDGGKSDENDSEYEPAVDETPKKKKKRTPGNAKDKDKETPITTSKRRGRPRKSEEPIQHEKMPVVSTKKKSVNPTSTKPKKKTLEELARELGSAFGNFLEHNVEENGAQTGSSESTDHQSDRFQILPGTSNDEEEEDNDKEHENSMENENAIENE